MVSWGENNIFDEKKIKQLWLKHVSIFSGTLGDTRGHGGWDTGRNTGTTASERGGGERRGRRG